MSSGHAAIFGKKNHFDQLRQQTSETGLLKKYHEKSDQIQLTREKVSVARAKLKTVQEHLLFCKTEEELHKIKKIYFNNAFGFYCEGNENLDKYVKEIDYKRYAHKVNYSSTIQIDRTK